MGPGKELQGDADAAGKRLPFIYQGYDTWGQQKISDGASIIK